MAKIFGPHAIRLWGDLGKTLSFGTWKGIGYVRARPRKHNERTEAQIHIRGIFASAVKAYQSISQEERLAWRRAAYGWKMSGYEMFISTYVEAHL